ncbi:MAG: hypothetical protein COB53_13530 [Elusimicrobia bacterium]|nr:MAG: hypothetical protein COB53_13530 [Elusimicrobiota bacterium]
MTQLLTHAGHRVTPYSTPGQFLDALISDPPELIVVALEIPGLSGWELIRLTRSMDATRDALVIAISDHDPDSKEVIHAFQLGADEFMRKPLEEDVFVARLQSLLRRNPTTPDRAPDNAIDLDGLRLDPNARTVELEAQPIKLTPLEFDLLAYLMAGKGRVMTRSLILQEVWKTEPDLNTRTVDKCVERLRKHLKAWTRRIETVSGVGYCLRL